MAKALINKEKWTQNDFRLLVVLVLTVIYPFLASSFFALFVFVIMPAIGGFMRGLHLYWLIATLLWVILCAVTLLCFQDTKVSSPLTGVSIEKGRPANPTKPHAAVQPFIMVEEKDEKQRLSLLTNKSKESSESIEKDMYEEKAEKESLETSKEDLGKSSASLEKGKITQSGEFLNDCIDSLGPEKLQEEEAECEVHAEQENKDNDQNKKDDIPNVQDKVDSTKDDATEKNKNYSSCNEDMLQTDENKDKITQDDKENDKVEDEPSEAVEPIIEQNEKIQTEAEPLQVGKGTIIESEIPEEEEMTELEEDKYLPTPKSALSGKQESNMVFLFVNPDIASTEEDIIVNQQGDIQEKEKKN